MNPLITLRSLFNRPSDSRSSAAISDAFSDSLYSTKSNAVLPSSALAFTYAPALMRGDDFGVIAVPRREHQRRPAEFFSVYVSTSPNRGVNVRRATNADTRRAKHQL